MNISSVIKFEGSNDDLVWKSRIENFNASSKLIVDPAHEALFVMNGTDCDLFGKGEHYLTTANLPFVSKIVSIPTDGVCPNPCSIYFINKLYNMAVLWGINREIEVEDPDYQVFLHIGMCGSVNFRVIDSRKFMCKIVGFTEDFAVDTIVSKFKGIIKKYAKSMISKTITSKRIGYFSLNERLLEMGDDVQAQLKPIFDDYGIEIVDFIIEEVSCDQKDLETIKKAKERRASRIIEGYSWADEQKFDVAKTFAGNEGTIGQMGGMMGGFMMGGAIGGSMMEMTKDVMNTASQQVPPNNLRGMDAPMQSGMASQQQGFGAAGFVGDFSNQQPMQQVPMQGMPMGQQPMQPMGQQSMQPMGQQPMGGGGSFCIGCGTQLAPGQMFCHKCGKQQLKECPNCHAQLMPDAAFCHMCGSQL